jgi:hypothetical protein
MKIKTLTQSCVISAMGVMLAQAVFAQGPGGTIISPTFSGTNGFYDLTGILSNITVVRTAGSSTTVPFSTDVSLVQSVTGTIKASNTETVVTVMAADGTFSNSAAYTLKGTVKSSRNNILFSSSLAVKSGAFLGGDPTYTDIVFMYSATSLATIDAQTGAITSSKTTGRASYRLGRKSGSGSITGMTTEPATFAPVAWSLILMPTSTATRVTGTATVNLANDRSFPFNIAGTTKNGASKLTLTGTDIGRGAMLKVTMSDTNITAITGSLLGQKINISQ